MSKHKEIEKLHDKQLEKKIEIKEYAKNELKEHKVEKIEHKEKPEPKELKDKDKDKEKEPIKEKHEPKEIKEPIKEKHEPKEIKEAAKEKIEVKEGPKEKHEPKEIKEPIKEHKDKDLEKQIFEKGGKELVEGQHPGVDVTNPPIATTHLGHAGGGAAAAAPKPKELENIKAPKEIDKIKAEKEHVEKIKPEKEQFKNELKDVKHEKNELKEHKNELKEHKNEFKEHKIEIKEVKHEKLEIKEIEKAQHKDLLPEKAIFEGGPKQIAEGGPIDKGTVINPGRVFKAKGKPEDRLADLEDAVTRLSHFIGADLRPDLSGGALKQEPDVAKKTPAKKTAAKRRARPKKTAG